MASVSPSATCMPSFTGSSVILPEEEALISFSIFIASNSSITSPASIVSPSAKFTCRIFPASSDTMAPFLAADAVFFLPRVVGALGFVVV